MCSIDPLEKALRYIENNYPFPLWYDEAVTNSVTRLDNFWKFLAANFLSKLALIIGDLLGYFHNSTFEKNYSSFDGNWAIF